MLMKKIMIVLIISVLAFFLFTNVVSATDSYLNNVKGFGGYQIYEDGNGEIVVQVGGQGSTAVSDMKYWKSSLDDLFAQYGKTITWVTGVATATLVAVFIWLCVKSAFIASEHWIIKRQTMMAMLWVGIGTAMMGSTTLILIIFQNAFI